MPTRQVKILFVITTLPPVGLLQQGARFSLLQDIEKIKEPSGETQQITETLFLIDGNNDYDFLVSLTQCCAQHQMSYQLSFLSEPVEWIQSPKQ